MVSDADSSPEYKDRYPPLLRWQETPPLLSLRWVVAFRMEALEGGPAGQVSFFLTQ